MNAPSGGHKATVVGGGLAGLAASIICAEAGVAVTLLEAGDRLGGRALTSPAPFAANYGPHALYADGPWWPWLKQRGLLPDSVALTDGGFRFLSAGRLRRLPPLALVRAAAGLRRGPDPSPNDNFRTWAANRVGAKAAAAAIGMISLATYDSDPGRLAADFARERFVRALRTTAVRYPVGGWSALVSVLEGRARALGVEIRTGSRTASLPAGPVIVATKLSAARRLMGDTSLTWPGAQVALLDIGLRCERTWPSGVLDLGQHVYVARYSAHDRTVAPPGHDLLQASCGMRPTETVDDAVARIERLLDQSFPLWRYRVVWRRQMRARDATGALDLPGSTWRDRPAVRQGDGVFLAGDMVAQPGLLSEVSLNSAVKASRLLLADVGARRA